MSTPVTLYPGVGADEKIAELHSLVGQITAAWAQVEDGLFQVFVVALAGTIFVDDLRPYRAVFFTFSSYESKLRMLNKVMRARFDGNEELMSRWAIIRTALDNFSNLRNRVAHLVPMPKHTTDPTAIANVRLVSPAWKGSLDEKDFSATGYSADELWLALKPFWGYHPRVHSEAPTGEERWQLAYRLQQFAISLDPRWPSPPTPVVNVDA